MLQKFVNQSSTQVLYFFRLGLIDLSTYHEIDMGTQFYVRKGTRTFLIKKKKKIHLRYPLTSISLSFTFILVHHMSSEY